MRPNIAICIVSWAASLQASAAVIALSHTPKTAGPGEPPASAAAPAASIDERIADNNAEAGPIKVWHGDHWYRGTIPKNVYVTGKWAADSAEVQTEISNNFGDAIDVRTKYINKDSNEYQNSVRTQVESYFARWAPIGSHVQYFTDEDMENDVAAISNDLKPLGLRNMYKLYQNLRPGAYRADVWRLLKLWKEGGIYLDANLNLSRKITDWIDFAGDELVLVRDMGVEDGYWNAIMASNERNDYILHTIMYVARLLQSHYYGGSSLGITGPQAVWKGVQGQHGFPSGIKVELEWKDGKVTGPRGEYATKDEVLHDYKDPSHYHYFFENHQVYCSEPGPTPDLGKCAR